MHISYKATYALLDRHCARRTLNSFISNDVEDSVFESSKLFAHLKEDYGYLSVMVEGRESYNKEFIFFTRPDIVHPIVVLKDIEITMLEFAALSIKSQINIDHFIEVIEAQAESKGMDAAKEIHSFSQGLDVIKSIQSSGNEHSG